ncbi:hypothetical protein BDY21DRAFT_151898 [Lineolata rhizophorae]|uniref:Uncharacterized protein n=1 Tax=Lineolata rhizophorae TaxID=578093 RepID=A0A6A6NM38_9PEZI|nr:hypothetical protein BDY21DRAFT_151898 [Lineolata rhizophorae]
MVEDSGCAHCMYPTPSDARTGGPDSNSYAWKSVCTGYADGVTCGNGGASQNLSAGTMYMQCIFEPTLPLLWSPFASIMTTIIPRPQSKKKKREYARRGHMVAHQSAPTGNLKRPTQTQPKPDTLRLVTTISPTTSSSVLSRSLNFLQATPLHATHLRLFSALPPPAQGRPPRESIPKRTRGGDVPHRGRGVRKISGYNQLSRGLVSLQAVRSPRVVEQVHRYFAHNSVSHLKKTASLGLIRKPTCTYAYVHGGRTCSPTRQGWQRRSRPAGKAGIRTYGPRRLESKGPGGRSRASDLNSARGCRGREPETKRRQ